MPYLRLDLGILGLCHKQARPKAVSAALLL